MDLVKVEKERAMLRYRRLRRAAALSRWLPQFLAALTFSPGSPAASPSPRPLRRRKGGGCGREGGEEEEEEEEEEVLVYEDKGVCLESVTSSATTKKGQLLQWKSEVLPHAVEEDDAEKQFRRSRLRWACGWSQNKEKKRRRRREEETKGCRMPAEDDGDEFRRRIEAFIAKQLSFIEREEESLLARPRQSPPPAAATDHRLRRMGRKTVV
ncbi:unnamed protein product [Spirodela intermedia]|uniref:Uncharacterized protein n=1 Tax=Spirodela intermedia TaxID=51605 RepID=A0A7I8J5A9_SPIIN|nr:unnamed protein product [Spirodela intermedia]CAA6665249.1 unnamed protein product [Spirodela intermedia]